MHFFQLRQTGVRAVLRVEIEYDQTRYGPGDDGDIGVWPASIPVGGLRWLRSTVLVLLPGDQRTFAAGRDGDERPTQTTIIEGRLQHESAGRVVTGAFAKH